MDVRDVITEKKHYTHLPHPLLKMIYSMGLTQSEERVYQAHWGAGQINGDWMSRIAINTLAEMLCISESSVKRAYKSLGKKGLIKRYPQGRSATDPMRSAVTLTEVLIPNDAIDELLDTPDRAEPKHKPADAECMTSARKIAKEGEIRGERAGPEFIPEKASEKELAELKESGHKTYRGFAKLTQAYVRSFKESAGRVTLRHVQILKAKLKARVTSLELDKVMNQMLWSMAHGQLSLKHPAHSMNIALQLLSRERWGAPYAMPKDWRWEQGGLDA